MVLFNFEAKWLEITTISELKLEEFEYEMCIFGGYSNSSVSSGRNKDTYPSYLKLL
jgi:hypothetical protein